MYADTADSGATRRARMRSSFLRDYIALGTDDGEGRQRTVRLHRVGPAAKRSRDTGAWAEVDRP